ncbi:hypothetical protein HX017_10730 [Myroides marinus]|uniref:hypothetical protein n=1 Tax=Myroides marinus TaxID=703342 RepID=UPI0025755FAA|nr:hypothetical protein [Myroides marinus]MDM1347550.1 hypothetical protein [Myroides marinus]MDM1350798.1 hypothetical protein [Myroides marinus]MDM1355279.1 hypothetical protein [Myroides marinus]MDM1358005.1 hypothetical protein [Myroides marinus]MDM1363249.1 hypothetical protein [Myroides marinus]
MNTKEFYSVLVPLINLILTGNKEVAIEHNCIKLSDGYKFSMEEYAQAKQSTHFYGCIHDFLEPLTQQQRVDIIKIIAENDVLVTTALLTDLLESKKTINDNLDNEAVFNKMMFEFLSGNNTHSVIYRVLYLYLENLHRLEIKKVTITKEVYERILKFNTQSRSNEDILNMFIFD